MAVVNKQDEKPKGLVADQPIRIVKAPGIWMETL